MLYYGLVLNGVLMTVLSFFLFFSNSRIIATIEGKEVAAQKTLADTMAWRILGLWVACIGLICLFVTDFPTGFWSSGWAFDKAQIHMAWRPLAYLLVITHTIEIGVKWIALNQGPKGIYLWLRGALGNILLALVLCIGLVLPA